MSWLESKIQREVEAAAWGKRGEVHEARNEIPTVVYFRIKPVVVRNDEEVPSREAEFPALRASETCRHPLRQVVRDVDLANLCERAIDEVSGSVGPTTPQVVAVSAQRRTDRRVGRRLVIVPGILPLVEEVEGHVGNCPSSAVVDEDIEVEGLVVHIVAEAHHVLGICIGERLVAHRRSVDDLVSPNRADTVARREAQASVGIAEATRRGSGSERPNARWEAGDVGPTLIPGRPRGPAEIVPLDRDQ